MRRDADLFAACDAPPEAHKLPEPTMAAVDAHPDALFIWSVILSVRAGMKGDGAVFAPRRRRSPIME